MTVRPFDSSHSLTYFKSHGTGGSFPDMELSCSRTDLGKEDNDGISGTFMFPSYSGKGGTSQERKRSNGNLERRDFSSW